MWIILLWLLVYSLCNHAHRKQTVGYNFGINAHSLIVCVTICSLCNHSRLAVTVHYCSPQHVSVSRTPGHTKHFQTIFLTQTVRLCDCPGLIFPSLINRQLQVGCSCLAPTHYPLFFSRSVPALFTRSFLSVQVLCCMYPIAQVREPFTIVGYLAERVPLVEILKLKHPSEEEEEGGASATHEWTAWDICDGGYGICDDDGGMGNVMM